MPDQATIAAVGYAIALLILAYKGVRFYLLGPAPEGFGKEWL